jgi:hypothetical protein
MEQRLVLGFSWSCVLALEVLFLSEVGLQDRYMINPTCLVLFRHDRIPRLNFLKLTRSQSNVLSNFARKCGLSDCLPLRTLRTWASHLDSST